MDPFRELKRREKAREKEAKKAEVKRIYHPRIELKQSDVAFSQPTESGARLARRWTGKAYGWLVYVG